MEQSFWQNNRNSIFEHRQKSQGFLILSLPVPIENRDDESGLRSWSLSRTFSVRGSLAMTVVCHYGYKLGFERRDKNKIIY